jgi:Domain of unknown function (DUF3390)
MGTVFDPVRPWTQTRDTPEVATESFHAWWAKRKEGQKK